MKKSVVVCVHIIFWLCFPLIKTFIKWSDQFGFTFFDKTGVQNPFQVFIGELQSLFVPFDMGRDFWDFFNLWEFFVGLLISVFLAIGVFYLYYGYFIPRAATRTKIKYKVIPIVFLFCFPFLFITLLSFCTFSINWYYTSYLVLTYSYTLFFAVAGTFFRLAENSINDRIIAEKLKHQNLQSELMLLKNQINPHFLFNTLNNIDSLIKKDADKASELLIDLSGMLRYMIYDSNVEKVPLIKEVEYLWNYIEIQKIQYSNEKLVSFVVENDTIQIQIQNIQSPGENLASLIVEGGKLNDVRIAPMLFITFVENAFKHCTDKHQLNAISFHLKVVENKIIFEANNIFDKTKIIRKDEVGGIGLQTVRRRLDLIYPEKYSVEISDENGMYHVLLIIDIHED